MMALLLRSKRSCEGFRSGVFDIVKSVSCGNGEHGEEAGGTAKQEGVQQCYDTVLSLSLSSQRYH